LALVPDLAGEEASGWRQVPWPQEEKPTLVKGECGAAACAKIADVGAFSPRSAFLSLRLGTLTYNHTRTGALDAAEEEILRPSWTPDLSSLSLAPSSSTAPKNPSRPLPNLAEGAPPELRVSQLDLGGAYWSRAKRQERFQEKKAREAQYGKIRSNELRRAAGRMASVRRGGRADEVDLA
jgi:hypothetical protein